jgi:AcrR family transcriptional regulator
MRAALDQLREKGVLAGLNLSEVADAAGVTPANIYHLFGSRQGLLRAALAREAASFGDVLASLEDTDVVGRRVGMFRAIAGRADVGYTALLALDGDPEYQPLPFLEETRAYYKERVAAGELPEDLDIDAMHFLVLAAAVGFAIYGEAVARQAGVDVVDLREREAAILERLLRDGLSGPGTGELQ